jgi:TonB family protein
LWNVLILWNFEPAIDAEYPSPRGNFPIAQLACASAIACVTDRSAETFALRRVVSTPLAERSSVQREGFSRASSVQAGIPLAMVPYVSAADIFGRPSPRLPSNGRLFPAGLSAVVHVAVAALCAVAVGTRAAPSSAVFFEQHARVEPMLTHIVFLPASAPGDAGGGGGGGNRQTDPIRHAEGVGSDAMTLRVKRPTPISLASRLAAAEDEPAGVVELDAVPLASGRTNQIGLPIGGVSYSTSTGPGSGGGVGEGIGTGIGPGHGPGIGEGSGGGIGGSVYRVGGGVFPPRVLREVKPLYTNDALQARVQGSVVLELVVLPTGRATRIRVLRSLEPGLDNEAIKAVEQWIFEPGRLGESSVSVQVTIVLEFLIH